MSRKGKLMLVLVAMMGFAIYMAPDRSPEDIAKARAERAEAKARDDSKAAEKAEQRDIAIHRSSAIEAAKKSVLSRLNDPESARFGKIVYRSNSYVCGYVNAKNQLGGYVGEREFMAVGIPAKAALYSDQGFEDSWNKHCASD